MPLPSRLIFAIGAAMITIVALVLYMGTLSQPEAGVPTPVTFEVADTPLEHERGLSGRTEVPPNYAMLFVFETPSRYGFWMQDMHVPIDIIWLDENYTVMKVDEAVSPDTFPTLYYPPRPTRYVLETAAGEANVLGWNVGTTIALPI